MEKEIDFNYVSKEVLTILYYLNEELIKKIPENIIQELMMSAADCNEEIVIDFEKDLENQNVSEECKDIIGLIYYNYIANEDNKRLIKEKWGIKDNNYNKELSEKYDIDKVFEERNKKAEAVKEEENALVKYKEENAFIRFIKRLLRINK